MPTVRAPVSVRDLGLGQACAELEQRLRAGQALAAEAVLAAHSELAADADSALQLIYEELVQRERLGEQPAYEEYYERFPQWQAELRRSFDVHEALVRGAGPTVAPATTMAPTRTGDVAADAPAERRYELLDEIGRGGMGVVYRARQPGLNRIVALKMILAGELASQDQRSRFRTEAETAARLQHPNIVQVYEVGEQDGRPFLAMELVPGGTLRDRLKDGPVAAEVAAGVMETLARAVQYAHDHGVLHRDLKPANVLLQRSGVRSQGSGTRDQAAGINTQTPESRRVSDSRPPTPDACPLTPDSCIPKITDFGLAKISQDSDTAAGPTHTGDLLGTPSYMAPEQAEGLGRDVGPAADVYALGAILYELLTGRPPFRAASPLETLEQVRSLEPVPPAQIQPRLPRDLQTICLACLRKEPGKRYTSAAALADDLHRFLSGEPIHAQPISVPARAWKWCRRRPVVACLLAAIFLISTSTAAVIVWQWQSERAQRESLEEALAANQVLLARQHWLGNEVDNAKRVLDDCPLRFRNQEWHQLHRLCFAELFCFRLREQMYHVVWSPDGRHLFGTSDQRKTSQWEAATGRHVADLSTGKAVPFVGFILAKRYPVICDGLSLRALDLETKKKEPATLRLNLVDVASGDPRTQVLYHGVTPSLWSLSSDGRRVAIEADKMLNVYDVGDELQKVAALGSVPGLPGNSLSFSDNGERLVRVHGGSFVAIWDVKSAKLAHSLPKQNFSIHAARLSARGRWLACVGGESTGYKLGGRIVVLDLASGTNAVALSKPLVDRPGHAIAFSPDERFVAWQGDRQEIVLLDLVSGREAFTLRGHDSLVMSLSFSPDGARLASACLGGTVRIWDVRSID